DTVSAVVVGIGLNLDWRSEIPSELAGRAVALSDVSGARPAQREALLTALLDSLAWRYADLESAGGWERQGRAYRRHCSTLGQEVRIEMPDETFTGTAADVTPEGHLIVDVGMCMRTVAAGDVVHLRAAH
ncbi:MAG: biotin--[acetyl-CoA-carboxylase] ligase, partial [Acidimicrobiales bacterium]